ncbi:ABC transporter substrate-binding protein [Kitasatospora sp. NPDC004614]|uniref:ABC transporter substrate-binding protein n=1 Tax=unclassified Kitasatospora TaxID=2633591 RepID=UPI003696DCF9
MRLLPRSPRSASGTIALLAAGALLLTACSGATVKPGPPASADGTGFATTALTPPGKGAVASFTWSLYAEPQSLDYALAYDYPPNTVLANVCEQLLRVTPDMKIEPGLATGFTNPDPRTWVYTLREGVKFHDGSTMTADDVVASLTRHLLPATGSAWGTAFKNVVAVSKTGPMQVTITLSKPDALLNELLAASPGTVESAAYLEKAGKDYGSPSGGVDCTGPYAIDRWTQGDSITLRKNPDYWDTALTPKADKVKFVFIGDSAARANGWLSGAVDGGYMVPSASLAQLGGTGKGKVYFGPNTAAADLAVLDLQGTLRDLKVRQALSLAIDRPGLIKSAAGGVGVPAKAPAARDAWGLAPERTAGYFSQLPDPVQDVAKAKQLIAEAGAGGKHLVMATSSLAPEISVVGNAVQAAGREIGLDVELRPVAPDAYTALFTDPGARAGIDLVVTNGYDNTPDPLEFYQSLRTGDFANYAGWSDPEYDSLFDQAVGTTDPAARADLTARLQQIAVRELPSIPLYEAPFSVFLGSRITGAPAGIAQLYYPWAATIGAAR